MPSLANPKHEMFARLIVQGLSQVDAYAKAGYEKRSANASTLAKRPEVKARVQELIDERERAMGFGNQFIEPVAGDPESVSMEIPDEFSVDWVLRELAENAMRARQAGNWGASNRALEMIGKAKGMHLGEEIAKRNGESNKDESGKPKQISIDKVEKLLNAAGFQGVIDLSTLEVQPEPALPVRKLETTNE